MGNENLPGRSVQHKLTLSTAAGAMDVSNFSLLEKRLDLNERNRKERVSQWRIIRHDKASFT
jgi:hypothetical protein